MTIGMLYIGDSGIVISIIDLNSRVRGWIPAFVLRAQSLHIAPMLWWFPLGSQVSSQSKVNCCRLIGIAKFSIVCVSV